MNIFAGRYDSSYIYHEYNPALELSMVWNEQISANVDIDSIDIDLDTKYDNVIKLAPDASFPFCQVKLNNGFEVAICKESFPIGHGQSATATFIDTLCYS